MYLILHFDAVIGHVFFRLSLEMIDAHLKSSPRPKGLRIVKFLQRGKVSQVYVAFTSPELFVIKRFKKKYMTKKDTDLVHNEIRINETLSHPHILKMHRTWETKQKIYLLFEYANEGDLFEHIQHKKYTRHMIIDIVSAVKYMHDCGIVHYDIKPENILVLNGRVMLADFGLSVDLEDKRRYINRCTLEYTAPEQVNISIFPEHLLAVDYWCIGILLYEISHGHTPYHGLDREKILDMVSHTPIQCVNKDYEQAIINLTQQTPRNRMTCSELLESLSALQSIDLLNEPPPLGEATISGPV